MVVKDPICFLPPCRTTNGAIDEVAFVIPASCSRSPASSDSSSKARSTIGRNVARLTALIAVANAAMSDDEPRKLKRVHVEALRAAAEGEAGEKEAAVLRELASAIESYLPR